jgi:hypothetical protein
MFFEEKRLKEVAEILKYFPVNELEKIPKEIFEYIHKNKDVNHDFVFDTTKEIYEQNINPDTISLLIYICKEYIYNSQQNDFLNRLEQIDIAQYYQKGKDIFGNKK